MPRLQTVPGKSGCIGIIGGFEKRDTGGNVDPPRNRKGITLNLTSGAPNFSFGPSLDEFEFRRIESRLSLLQKDRQVGDVSTHEPPFNVNRENRPFWVFVNLARFNFQRSTQ